MIIQSLELTNFGVYGGRNVFDLAPRSDEQFNQPVVLFSGKNGAGKTTFVEAIRLCLHGSLALGSRVRQKDYEKHLLQRIHRSFQDGKDEPDGASIKLEFDFVRSGEQHRYEVERSWHRTSKSVSEQLSILEDGESPDGLSDDQKDSFLRELVPSSAAELFFFDGEKIQKLMDEAESSEILSHTVKSLLGLHLVDRLDADLQVYISRRADEDKTAASEELEDARQDLERLRSRRKELKEEQAETEEALQEKYTAIERQKQRLQGEGGEYAEKRNELEQRQEVLEQKIDTQKKHIQGLADGIMPFAVAPTMCRSVKDRLDIEREHQKWKTSQSLIDEQVRQLSSEIRSDDFWASTGLERSPEKEEKLIDTLTNRLRASNPAEPVDESKVIIHASERERGKLTNWIDEALTSIPGRFREAAQELIDLEAELESVEKDLERVPQDLLLQPLVETLNGLQSTRDDLQKQLEDIADEIGTVEFKTERAENRLERAEEKLAEERAEDERIKRAIQTKKAFREYARRLKKKKLTLLEDSLTKRFRELCRKERVVDDVRIHPDTFEIDLFRGNQTMKRDALSKGEQQLFAIATIWALREVSGVPMPVIIDTPLGRLDNTHRMSMIQTYLPRASHQVMLLATDAEVDAKILKELEPALSHAYELHFDDSEAQTVVNEINLDAGQQEIFDTLEEEVAA